MSDHICKAKLLNGKPCENKSKYDGLCGIHKNKALRGGGVADAKGKQKKEEPKKEEPTTRVVTVFPEVGSSRGVEVVVPLQTPATTKLANAVSQTITNVRSSPIANSLINTILQPVKYLGNTVSTVKNSIQSAFSSFFDPVARGQESTPDDLSGIDFGTPKLDSITTLTNSHFKSLKTIKITPSEPFKDLNAFNIPRLHKISELIKKGFESYDSFNVYFRYSIRLIKEDDETMDFGVITKKKTFLTSDNIIQLVQDLMDDAQTKLDELETRGTGWKLDHIYFISLEFTRYKPLRGSSYIELPDVIKKKEACINVKNKDDKCLIWAILSCLYPVNGKDHPNRVSKYAHHFDEYFIKCKDMKFPARVCDMNQFETKLKLSINVYTFNKNNVLYPLYISKHKITKLQKIDLLFYQEDIKSHYIWIKDFSALVHSQMTKDTRKRYYCHYCLKSCLSLDSLDKHELECIEMGTEERIIMPFGDNAHIKFINGVNQLFHPFVAYADIESDLIQVTSCKEGKTQNIHKHKINSFAVKLVCRDDPSKTRPVHLYRGSNAGKYFLDFMSQLWKDVQDIYKAITPMNLSETEENEFQNSTKCWFCGDGNFCKGDEEDKKLHKFKKVRDHCHLTGQYRGSAHSCCNLKARTPHQLPCFFHNGKGYDFHEILASVCEDEKITCIPLNEEKYVSFTVNGVKFLDSMAFLPSSLDSLVENLKDHAGVVDKIKRDPTHSRLIHTSYQKDLSNRFAYMSNHFKDDFELLCQKGVYPYEIKINMPEINDIFSFSDILPKNAFNNKMNATTIKESDYSFYKRAYTQLNCKNFGEYHDIYLTADVLLLADVFENFRFTAHNTYGLDPARYVTIPGYAWDCMLKYTGEELELLTQQSKYVFLERGLRGGISMISNRHAVANNSYMKEGYDENKPNSFIIDLDANNLYGWAMSQPLPFSNFNWVNESWNTFTSNYIMNMNPDDPYGAILEVDLEYPSRLHDLHNDYPVCPEKMSVSNSMLSPYSLNLKRNGCEDVELPEDKTMKLVPNLLNKKRYVIHYRNLQQAMKLGLRLTKVRRVLTFTQKSWLKPYIDFNTSLRAKAKNAFEKDFFKLMNNSVFGKTMENVRGRIDFRLCTNDKQLDKLSSKPEYLHRNVFTDNLVGVHLKKTMVKLDKPIYAGFAILELSKHLMYDFHYNTIKVKYGNKAKLLGTDTDSLKYIIETPDLYKDMNEISENFDFSSYPPEHPCYDTSNKKVVGKFKDEMDGNIIERFTGIRPKVYAQLTYGIPLEEKELFVCPELPQYNELPVDRKLDDDGYITKKVLKGIKKSFIKAKINYQNYEDCVLQSKTMSAEFNNIRSSKHVLYTTSFKKSALNPFDSKRYILDDCVTSYAHGHYLIK
eukprot:Lithocolla_globosa_v1_NODE_1_length_16663_cov_42.954359.p1 type:complete len:1376 gc:universal NODE_1_length_16663_cov_42.954359:11827-15954(+)